MTFERRAPKTKTKRTKTPRATKTKRTKTPACCSLMACYSKTCCSFVHLCCWNQMFRPHEAMFVAAIFNGLLAFCHGPKNSSHN